MKLHAPARIAAVALVVVSLAGCSFAANITTSKQYSASDGVRVELEDVTGLNLLLVATAEGDPAALTGTFENSGTEDVAITLGLGATSDTVTVPAGGVVALGLGDGETAVVGASPANPGMIGQITVETPRSGTESVDVPVLDGTLAEYADTLDKLQSYTG
ncbi:hypothetical protein RN607_02275 [Demequina capsici]|uniref:DNA modification methylase n=1 Tax=Demequina capsici TaxID=3075620 RepID=A0AA96JBA5_9MICO|nr:MULTISPECIES: hypothetical protein [unclassified Demequina]WNM24946.1 hypothetical protein RN606_02000 [Demequina sp. OYTSA14]WNM27853.1 hypothetical protein RN607_02275 [Demequina sp. PMTSA13]